MKERATVIQDSANLAELAGSAHPERMKTIEISRLRQELSVCLKPVRNGEGIVVLSQGKPVAKIVPYRGD